MNPLIGKELYGREGLQEPLLQVCAGYHAQQPGQVADWVREQLRVDVAWRGAPDPTPNPSRTPGSHGTWVAMLQVFTGMDDRLPPGGDMQLA